MSTGPVAPCPAVVKENLIEDMPPRHKDAASLLENGFHSQNLFTSVTTMVSAFPTNTIVSSGDVAPQPSNRPNLPNPIRALTKCQKQKNVIRSLRIRTWLEQRRVERRLAHVSHRVSKLQSEATVRNCKPVLHQAAATLESTSNSSQLAVLLESDHTNDSWLDRLLDTPEQGFSSLTEQILKYHEHLDPDATDSDSDVSVASGVSEEAVMDNSFEPPRVADPSAAWWQSRAELHSQTSWLRGRIDSLDASIRLCSLLTENLRTSRRKCFDATWCAEVEQSASRCVLPPASLLQEQSDVIQLGGVAREIRRRCGGSVIDCCCHPPMIPCIVCCGRMNRCSTARNDRPLLVEPTVHPALPATPSLVANVLEAANKSRKRRLAPSHSVNVAHTSKVRSASGASAVCSRRKSHLQRSALRRDSGEQEPELPPAVRRIRSEEEASAQVTQRRSSAASSRSSRSSVGPVSPATLLSLPPRFNGNGAAEDSPDDLELSASSSVLERLTYAEIVVPAWRLTPMSVSNCRVGLYRQGPDGSLVLTRASSVTDDEDISDVNYLKRHRNYERVEQQRNMRTTVSPDEKIQTDAIPMVNLGVCSGSSTGYPLRQFPLDKPL